MKFLTKKGMTLFELLAVIVILGIVAAIAFPTVNTLINNSRRNAFIEEANSIVAYAKTLAQQDLQEDSTLDTLTYTINVETDPEGSLPLDGDFDTDITATIVFTEAGEISSISASNDNFTINGATTTPLTKDHLVD